MDMTTSNVFQSWIEIGTFGTRLDGPGKGYVSLNLDRQEKISSMLVELLISCCYANNVGEFGFGLQMFERFNLIIISYNDKLLTFNGPNSVGLKFMNMVIQINSQACIKSFKCWLGRSQHFHIQCNAACKS